MKVTIHLQASDLLPGTTIDQLVPELRKFRPGEMSDPDYVHFVLRDYIESWREDRKLPRDTVVTQKHLDDLQVHMEVFLARDLNIFARKDSDIRDAIETRQQELQNV